MYTFLLQNASKLIYGSLIAIALYACWNVYDNYQDMKQTIITQSETIAYQKNQNEILATVADNNAAMYKKSEADKQYLLQSIGNLNKTITELNKQQQAKESNISKEIDNAPQEIKQCLRSPIPESVINSLRKPTEARN